VRFFTSDLHFWHKNVIQFCNRPWSTVEEMNAGLIEIWNQTVTQNDDVFIIGDMFFCGTAKLKEIMSQLNGNKYLIQGNHDWGVVKIHRAEEFGFKWVQRNQHCIRIGHEDVYLCHFPYDEDHTAEVRYKEMRPVDIGNWLLHGHVHCAWKVRGRQINVGVDVWDWRPVSEVEIQKIIGTYHSTGIKGGL